MSKKFDFTDVVGYFAILIIVASLAFIGLKMTGHATDTAVINVTITEFAAINFTTDFVNFTAGSVNAGASGATINTEGGVTDGTWTPISNGLVLENIGNLNVTLLFRSSINASEFIGGDSPTFKVKVTDKSGESGACQNNNALSYTNITTEDFTVCSPLQYNDSIDEIDVDVELYIPSSSFTGERTATITATGNAV